MTKTLWANGVLWTVRLHARRNMLERYIKEAWVIWALEEGDMIEQPHGNTIYELELLDEEFDETRIIRVVVNASEGVIIRNGLKIPNQPLPRHTSPSTRR